MQLENWIYVINSSLPSSSSSPLLPPRNYAVNCIATASEKDRKSVQGINQMTALLLPYLAKFDVALREGKERGQRGHYKYHKLLADQHES